jgi:hypothetical protein
MCKEPADASASDEEGEVCNEDEESEESECGAEDEEEEEEQEDSQGINLDPRISCSEFFYIFKNGIGQKPNN